MPQSFSAWWSGLSGSPTQPWNFSIIQLNIGFSNCSPFSSKESSHELKPVVEQMHLKATFYTKRGKSVKAIKGQKTWRKLVSTVFDCVEYTSAHPDRRSCKKHVEGKYGHFLLLSYRVCYQIAVESVVSMGWRSVIHSCCFYQAASALISCQNAAHLLFVPLRLSAVFSEQQL